MPRFAFLQVISIKISANSESWPLSLRDAPNSLAAHADKGQQIDEVRVYYDVTEDTVEILAIIDKSEAAAWLAKAGETQ